MLNLAWPQCSFPSQVPFSLWREITYYAWTQGQWGIWVNTVIFPKVAIFIDQPESEDEQLIELHVDSPGSFKLRPAESY